MFGFISSIGFNHSHRKFNKQNFSRGSLVFSGINNTSTALAINHSVANHTSNGSAPSRLHWIQKQRKIIPCCAWDSEEAYLNDPRYCTSDFSVASDGSFTGALKSLAFSGGHSCSCRNFNSKLSYHHDVDWNASLFCSLLGNRCVFSLKLSII
jgi:hypothetical protein